MRSTVARTVAGAQKHKQEDLWLRSVILQDALNCGAHSGRSSKTQTGRSMATFSHPAGCAQVWRAQWQELKNTNRKIYGYVQSSCSMRTSVARTVAGAQKHKQEDLWLRSVILQHAH